VTAQNITRTRCPCAAALHQDPSEVEQLKGAIVICWARTERHQNLSTAIINSIRNYSANFN